MEIESNVLKLKFNLNLFILYLFLLLSLNSDKINRTTTSLCSIYIFHPLRASRPTGGAFINFWKKFTHPHILFWTSHLLIFRKSFIHFLKFFLISELIRNIWDIVIWKQITNLVRNALLVFFSTVLKNLERSPRYDYAKIYLFDHLYGIFSKMGSQNGLWESFFCQNDTPYI